MRPQRSGEDAASSCLANPPNVDCAAPRTRQDGGAHAGAVVDPRVAEHGGRIVKTTGDGLLVEFPSVVEAVQCAVEIQQGVAELAASVPEERRIRLRIGINLGDVIYEDGDVFGDGVNIAARLEALGIPEG